MLALLSFYLLVVFFTFNQIEEDAFIYFRLAANLAEGHGYVFNIGGERIESGSGLLWQLLLALAWLLPVPILAKAKLLGVAFGGLALWLTCRIARHLITEPLLRYAPALLLTCSIPFFCWVQRGLETPFYVAALLTLCWFCLEERLRRFWYVPAFVVCASRPEGFLALVALAPFLLLYRKQIDGGPWRGIAIVAGLFALLTLFRLAYFHDPFPHPFYIKAATSVATGWRKMRHFFLDNHLIYLVIPAALPYLRARAWSPATAVVTGFAAFLLGWMLLAREGFGPYDRHLTPALPFVFLLVARGVEQLAPARVPRWALTATCAGFALLMLVFGRGGYMLERPKPSLFSNAAGVALRAPLAYTAEVWKILSDPDDFATAHPQKLRDPINTNYQATTGKFIALNYPKDVTLVYDQMGQTPWYAGRDKTVIDSYGLLDKKLGYRSFHRRAEASRLLELYDDGMTRLAKTLWPDEPRRISDADALGYIFSHRPELILVNELVAKQLPRSTTARLKRSKRLRQNYRLAYRLSNVVQVYERRDISARKPLQVPAGMSVETLGSR